MTDLVNSYVVLMYSRPMRPDMAKVVTERPRRGHGAKSLKTARRLSRDEITTALHDDDDFGPAKAPVARRRQFGYDCKEFSDLLGPIKGYLRKQIGRPWNKVWSELSATLDKRSNAGSHIFDHIRQEIEIDPIVYGKRAYTKGRFSYFHEIDGLYVDPRTGLVREQKAMRSKAAYRANIARNRKSTAIARFGIDVEKLAGAGYERAVSGRTLYSFAEPAKIHAVIDRFHVASETVLWEKKNGAWLVHTYAKRDPKEVVRTDEVVQNSGVRVLVPRTRKDLRMPLLERVSTRSANRKDIKRVIGA